MNVRVFLRFLSSASPALSHIELDDSRRFARPQRGWHRNLCRLDRGRQFRLNRNPAVFRQGNRSLRIEPLEDRNLLTIVFEDGLVGVLGTKGNDIIHIQVPANPGLGDIQIDMNGERQYFNSWNIDAIVIAALAGDDQITVEDDVWAHVAASGGKGSDTIQGGQLEDLIFGDAGDDIIDGGGQDDQIDGGAGNDRISGGTGRDEIRGGKGNDTIDGEDGVDFCYGGSGNDILRGGAETDALHGDAGNDEIYGDDGSDVCYGRAGNDLIYGGDDDDWLRGDAGNDTVYGEGGNDTCYGGTGIDLLEGSDGDDNLWGDTGADTITGQDDDDFIDGGKGNDDCAGGDGDDRLKGGAGVDRLDGGSGDNILDQDNGNGAILNGLAADLDGELVASSVASNRGVTAVFNIENVNGVLITSLRVDVWNFWSNQSYDVNINGVIVGQITTGASGDGVLVYSTHPSGNELPFPAGFPAVRAGSKIKVDDLLGKFTGLLNILYG